MPPLCQETQSLGQQMLELSCENATVGTNGLCVIYVFVYVLIYLECSLIRFYLLSCVLAGFIYHLVYWQVFKQNIFDAQVT